MLLYIDSFGNGPFQFFAGGISLLISQKERPVYCIELLDVPASDCRGGIPPEENCGTAIYLFVCSMHI